MMNLKWNQIGVSLLIGILIGTFIGASPLRYRVFHKAFRKDGPPHDRLLKRFGSRLDLDREQEKLVGDILRIKRTKLDAIFSEMRPRFEAVRKETSDEIRKILNPDQQEKFQSLEMKMEKRFKGRFPHSPPHP